MSLDHMEYPGAPYSASIPIGAVTSSMPLLTCRAAQCLWILLVIVHG